MVASAQGRQTMHDSRALALAHGCVPPGAEPKPQPPSGPATRSLWTAPAQLMQLAAAAAGCREDARLLVQLQAVCRVLSSSRPGHT